MADALPNDDEIIDSIKNAAGIILGVSENRSWIELFFEGDLMHTKTVNLPAGSVFDIYVEEITHKATVYEHPRTMISSRGLVTSALPVTGTASSSQGVLGARIPA